MFERNKNKQASPMALEIDEPLNNSAFVTQSPATVRNKAMIGPSIKIKGTVTGEEDLVIQGKVEGTVNLQNYEVTIGQTGEVAADIQAKIIKIDGKVAGDISGGEKVVISKSGNVHGNITAPRVTLEDGALFKGSIDMDPGEKTARVALAPEAPKKSSPSKVEMATPLDAKSG